MAKRKFSLREYPLCAADQELKCLIKARYNLLYVVTWEEKRVINNLVQICNDDDISIGAVHVWDAASGIVDAVTANTIDTEESIESPDAILDYILKEAKKQQEMDPATVPQRGPIYVLCDIYRYLEAGRLDPLLERKIRALSDVLKRTTIHVVMTSPELQLPTSLKKCVTVVDYPLPEPKQIEVLVENAKNQILTMNIVPKSNLDDPPTEKVVKALQGLTFQEAEDALAKSIVKRSKFDVGTLNDIKRQIIRKGQLLDYLPAEEGLDAVGGFNGLKEFMRLRKEAFSEEAREYGLPSPKGIFFLGLQGTGKSLCAKAVAHELQVPLLKLDMGSMFSPYIGDSESNMRRALAMAESVAPCVLFVDEVNLAVSGTSSGDSGVTRRIIANLLEWMQTKTSPVMIVASANSLDGLPPAMLRKGRFDEMFFVDLPSMPERREIFSIHIAKRKRKPESYDLAALTQKTTDFSGAEIENVIIEAMHLAFADSRREFSTVDMEHVIDNSKPLARMDAVKEYIARMRDEAKRRMRNVSDPLYKAKEAAPEDVSRFLGMKTETKP